MLDHWDYPTDGKGDCKIYALWKRKLLIDMGLPRQALLMTIVRDLEGEGHTILTVKTDRGDLDPRQHGAAPSARGTSPATSSSSASPRPTPTCGSPSVAAERRTMASLLNGFN